MLQLCIFFTGFTCMYYIFNRYNRDSSEALFLFSLCGIFIIWSIYFLITPEEIPFFIFIIIFTLFFFSSMYVFFFSTNENSNYIKAKQQSYWGIDANKIINAFKNRAIEKKDRIEVNINIESLYFSQKDNKRISPQIFQYFKKMEEIYKPIVIDNIKQARNFKLHYKIFLRLQNLLEEEKEIQLDYSQLLKKFENRFDFLIIYLWDRYSKNINIGIAQLEIYGQNDENLQEFINCLDNRNLNKSKFKGSYLEYKYLKFLEKEGINYE